MKFLLLLVLSFAAIFGFTAAQQNCTTIQWDPNNQKIVTILDTDFQQAVAEAIQDEQIESCTWNWTKVINEETCNPPGTTSYSFSVFTDNVCSQTQLVFSLLIDVDNESGDIKLVGSNIFPI